MRRRTVIAGGAVGALVGFVVAFLLYRWLNPILEDRRDWLREMQGFLFTLIPVATLLGALAGAAVMRRARRS